MTQTTSQFELTVPLNYVETRASWWRRLRSGG